MKILFYLLTSLLFALPALHAVEPGVVSETAAAIRYRQPDGLEVTLPKHPKRVVIGYGSLVPVWYCAGGTAAAIPDHPLQNRPAPGGPRPPLRRFLQFAEHRKDP